MKFKESLLARTIMIPVYTWRNDCLYAFVLKSPYLILLLTVGILTAVVIDFFVSMGSVKYEP